MDKEKAADQYVESVIIDLSKQLTAAENRIEALEEALLEISCSSPHQKHPYDDGSSEPWYHGNEDDYYKAGLEVGIFRMALIARAALGEKKDDN